MSRRRGRGNARAKLQKQLEIQREYEKELEQLNNADDVGECAKSIIKHVEQSGSDPMRSEENPFWENRNNTCCIIL